jgi:hypothetical protein
MICHEARIGTLGNPVLLRSLGAGVASLMGMGDLESDLKAPYRVNNMAS